MMQSSKLNRYDNLFLTIYLPLRELIQINTFQKVYFTIVFKLQLYFNKSLVGTI